jgi:hypothetical protein
MGHVLATVVDWTAVWQTVVASIVTGVGVTTFYGVAIYGTSRFADLNRSGRSVAATAAAALAVAAALACVVSIVLGIIVMTSK